MQRFLPLLIAVVVVVGGATWYLNRPDEVGKALEKEGGTAPVLERDAGALAPAERDGSAALAPGTNETEALEGADARTAAGVATIEGTVELPPGAPGASLFVWGVPLGSSIGESVTRDDLEAGRAPDDAVRVPVQDGRFRIPVRAADVRVALALDSDWLFLPAPTIVSRESQPVLRPELGGALEIVAHAPVGDDAPLEGVEVELSGSVVGGMSGPPGAQRTVRLDAGGRALVRALDADLSFRLESVPDTWAAVVDFGIEVEPGATAWHEVSFRLGGRIVGVVRDESGEPVEGTAVEWDGEGRFRNFGADRDPVRTDAEGRYRLLGIRPGTGVVRATAERYREARTDELRVADGEELVGVDLTLETGFAIAGVVVSESGEPLEEVRVRARRESGGRPWGRRGGDLPEDETDEGGRFRVTGLVEGDYELDARRRDPSGGMRWRRTLDDVRAGTTDLRVVLAPPPGITVAVEDASGARVAGARVSVTNSEPRGGGAPWMAERPIEEMRFEGSADTEREGLYFVEGPWPGRWFVTVEAEGLAHEDAPLEVVVEDRDVVVVRMVPTASLAGLVLSPNGDPVPNARVRLVEPSADRAMFGNVTFFGGGRHERADEDGRFAFPDVPEGAYELFAEERDEWVASETLGVELASGERRADVLLQLRRGGFVEGVVHDPEGRPEEGRTIRAFGSAGGGTGEEATSDTAGNFRLGPLAPGDYQVMAQPDMARVQERLEDDDDPSSADFMQEMSMTTATVVEGETTRVVLGGRSEAPVRVHGRVTRAGEPVTEGMVTLIREGGSMLDGFAPADVGEDGRYELELGGPGRAVATWSGGNFGPSGFELAIDVPARTEFRLDIELPGGAIEGRVVDAGGAPLPGTLVSLETRQGLGSVTGLGMGRAAMSDEDGRFRFENLEEGAYDLRAGGPSFFGSGSGHAATVVEGVEVHADATTDGVRVELSDGGAVEGRVVAVGGKPVRGATLFARRADGRLLARTSVVDTDANGRFRYAGLPAGEVQVEARADGASCAPVRVRVTEGGTTEIELRLESATEIVVRAEDADGEPLRVRLSVTDADGREMAGMNAMSGLRRRMMGGFDSSARRVGPLAPGEYRVTATDAEGRQESDTVRLGGEERRELRLRFGGN